MTSTEFDNRSASSRKLRSATAATAGSTRASHRDTSNPAKIELRLDKDCIGREDLLIIQYRNEPVWLRVSATCATHGKYAKKTSLTLSELLVNRTAMNNFHSMVRQMPLEL